MYKDVCVILQDMVIICNEEISKLRKLEETDTGGGAQQRGSVNASVADDVVAIFRGKTVGQVINLSVNSECILFSSLLHLLLLFSSISSCRFLRSRLMRRCTLVTLARTSVTGSPCYSS